MPVLTLDRKQTSQALVAQQTVSMAVSVRTGLRKRACGGVLIPPQQAGLPGTPDLGGNAHQDRGAGLLLHGKSLSGATPDYWRSLYLAPPKSK